MRRALVVPVLLLALAGCSDDPAPVASDDPVVESPSTSPTAVQTPSEGPSPSPSAPAATKGPAVDGDVDGDGSPDAVKATAELLTVTLSGGGTVTAPVHADSPAPPEVLGSTDVDRDGRAEVFVKTVQGASTTFATPYRYDGKVLHELQLDGEPALLGFGGSTQHGDGFRCTPAGTVEVRKAEADSSGSSYTVETTTYRLTATDLVRVTSATTSAKQGSPEVDAAYSVDCGSVGG